MKIYLASSWRNQRYPAVLAALRAAGHEVYDFKDPAGAFQWSAIDEKWLGWDAAAYIEALDHPEAVRGFGRDMGALRNCDACVLLLPCGRSAHIEGGWARGAGKPLVILLEGENEPELMYAMADLLTPSVDAVCGWLADYEARQRRPFLAA